MAISKALEEYLATLPKETADVLRPIAEANPGLGEGWLRQADYDRMMDQAKITQKEAKEANDKAWDWYNENIAKYNSAIEELKTTKTRVTSLEADNQTLQARIAAAASGAIGDDVDAEALKAQLKTAIMEEVGKRGYVGSAELNTIAETKLKELVTAASTEARNAFYQNDFPAVTEFNLAVTEIMLDHRQEFNEKLDRAAFAKFMQDNKLVNPKTAYEQYVADRRLQLKIEAARKEGLEAGKQEALKAQIPGSGVVPGAGTELGHMQLRLTTPPDKSTAPPDVEVGTGALAAIAAQELRAEGKV